jgi:hypothetical protein
MNCGKIYLKSADCGAAVYNCHAYVYLDGGDFQIITLVQVTEDPYIALSLFNFRSEGKQVVCS